MTAYIADTTCLQHEPGPGHPESPRRFEAVARGLEEAGLTAKMQRAEPLVPEREDLVAVHAEAYLKLAESEIRAGNDQLSTGDTSLSPRSWEAALKAAGSALAAVDLVMSGKVANAFAQVRPPGHHASPARGMGFCILNNVALAARRAQRRHGLERVLIVDWDVHHGNGTQDTFYEDPSVFFFSTHQSPWYPGTGAEAETGSGKGKGTTLNCPLPAGSGHAEIFRAFREQLIPAADKFKPELILISAGFDSRIGDPLGHFTLSDQDFFDLTVLLKQLAGRHCAGRIVSMLEGGYALSGLASAATAHVRALHEG
jgi:acetoin utilization deacetylase AcuC-like enzyme